MALRKFQSRQRPAGVSQKVELLNAKVREEMFFFVDGRASLCCWDTFERGVVGDVRTESVTDIWNGAVLGHYRSLLDQGRRDQIFLCSGCDAYREHEFPTFETELPQLAG